MITSSVPQTRTFRATPSVEPARASVVVSLTEGSTCRGSAIMLSSRNHCSPGQRAGWNRVPVASGGRYRRSVEKECLGDRRLRRRALKRLGDEERGLGPRARQQPLREGG